MIRLRLYSTGRESVSEEADQPFEAQREVQASLDEAIERSRVASADFYEEFN